MRKTINIGIIMDAYIAHPYWPERERVIRIQRNSGMARQKTDEKRDAALKAQLGKEGVTMEEYHELVKKAARQWYTNADGKIIIPRHQLAGAFVQTVGTSPKALRGAFEKDSFRSVVQVGDFVTEKTAPDGVFSRYVKLETSNMRSLQENEFIGNCSMASVFGKEFPAVGTLSIPEDADEKFVGTLKRVFIAALGEVGIGAARKMGFGRGVLKEWTLA